uniref:MATE family efflux transporter n=2 Tax=Bacteria TaxID=2 RepID=UPI00190F8031
IPGMAISQATLSVTSQCIGAGDYNQTKHYTKKLVKISTLCISLAVMLTFISMPLILNAYNLSDYTATISKDIILY